MIKKILSEITCKAAEALEKGERQDAMHYAGVVYATILNSCAISYAPKRQAEILMAHIALTTRAVFSAARRHSKLEVSSLMQQIIDDMEMWKNSLVLEHTKANERGTVPEICFGCAKFYKECLNVGFLTGKPCTDFEETPCQSASNQ
jgi:hypothetical protein